MPLTFSSGSVPPHFTPFAHAHHWALGAGWEMAPSILPLYQGKFLVMVQISVELQLQ